jgi:GT2 family glycosyltransferase
MTTHSICIVTYERSDFLRRCLESLQQNVATDADVVVVDASATGSATMVDGIRPSTRYVHAPQLAGWMTRSRNEALRHIECDIVSFIDDDVVVSATWQRAVLVAFADPTVAAVAGRTRNLQPGEDSYDQPVGRLLPDGTLTEGFASLPGGVIDVDHGIGANMSFRRAMLALLGGFRDDYPGTAMREDTDIFLRVKRAGGRAVFVPDAVVDHLPAPHVKGERFDTRYKLYARRNHMVLLARDAGIRSPSLRRWIRREFRSVGDAPNVWLRVRRFGVTVIGVAWGSAAMVRDAGWAPTAPVRDDRGGRELRESLSR